MINNHSLEDAKNTLPPHDLETERKIIGAVMFFSDALDHCSGRIGPDDFYNEQHRCIWQSIEDALEFGNEVTPPAVDEAHRRRYGNKADVLLMSEICSQVVTGATIKTLVSALEDRSARRAMLAIGHHIGNNFADPTVDPEQLREHIETELLEQAQKDNHGVASSMSEMLTDILSEVEEAHKRGGVLRGWTTGLSEWNGLLSEGGFVTGQHILAAGTSQGKTALALKTSLAVLNAGGIVVFFAMEMTKRALMFRLLSMESNVEGWKLKRGKLTAEEWTHVTQAASRLAQMKFHAIDRSAITIAGARSILRRIKRQHGLDFVVVDYLQLMGVSKSDSREQEVSKISRGLKGLAQDFNVPFLTLSQLSRSHEQRSGKDKEPRLSDLRESGSIEQDADSVTFIFQPSRYGLTAGDGSSLDGIAKILLRKQRDGPVGEFWVNWSGETMKFSDVTGTRVDPFKANGEEDKQSTLHAVFGA